MNKATRLRIRKDVKRYWNRSSNFELNYEALVKFVIRQVKKGQVEILNEAVQRFEKHANKPMTGNVVNLELKQIRGDYEAR